MPEDFLQVIFALPPENGVDYTMRIYNSDGSEPEMCGNGIRCLARFVAEKDGSGPVAQKIHTLGGAQDYFLLRPLGNQLLGPQLVPNLQLMRAWTAIQSQLCWQPRPRCWTVTLFLRPWRASASPCGSVPVTECGPASSLPAWS